MMVGPVVRNTERKGRAEKETTYTTKDVTQELAADSPVVRNAVYLPCQAGEGDCARFRQTVIVAVQSMGFCDSP
jgi:hypothetical protein